MKIGINLIQYTDIQGIEVFAQNIVREMIALAPDDKFVIFGNQKTASLFAFSGANVRLVVKKFPRLSSLALIVYQQFGLRRAITKERIDVLYCPSIAHPLFSKKTVVTIHDCATQRYPDESRGFLNRVYVFFAFISAKRCARRIVTVSEFSKKEIVSVMRVSDSKIAVVSEGVPKLPDVSAGAIASVRTRFSLPENYFFYIGNTRPRKNIERLILAFARYRVHGGLTELVLAGKIDDSLVNIAALIQKNVLADVVHRIGTFSDEEKVALYRGSRALVFPSLYEGFGLPVLEAQQCGVSVLTSRSSSLPEVAGNGAIFVDPLDVDALADGLADIDTKEDLRREIIVAGYENVKRFSWTMAARRLLAVVRPV